MFVHNTFDGPERRFKLLDYVLGELDARIQRESVKIRFKMKRDYNCELKSTHENNTTFGVSVIILFCYIIDIVIYVHKFVPIPLYYDDTMSFIKNSET